MQVYNQTIKQWYGDASGVTFVVPAYQRNFEWREKDVARFFEDAAATAENRKRHFVGAICFSTTNSQEREIIDGQQRLTTACLILRAVAETTDDELLRDHVFSLYLKHHGWGIDPGRSTKLRLNEEDMRVWETILEDDAETAKEELAKTKRDSTSRLWKGYAKALVLARTYAKSGKSLGDIVKAMDMLSVVAIEIEGEDPQVIFETINSTGVDLTDADRLRNWAFMAHPREKQDVLYRDYWTKIEAAVGQDDMSRFFVDHLVKEKGSDSFTVGERKASVNERSIYEAYKDWQSSKDGDAWEKTVEAFVAARADAKAWAALRGDRQDFDPSTCRDESEKIAWYLTYPLDSKKAGPLVLFFAELEAEGKITKDERDAAMRTVESFALRSKVCGMQGPSRQKCGNVISSTRKAMAKGVPFAEAFESAIVEGKGKYAFPTDEEFVAAMETEPLYATLRAACVKYVLYRLEETKPWAKGIPSYHSEDVSVEHIAPRSVEKSWASSVGAEEAERLAAVADTIGNLTLTNVNSEMGARPFAEKKSWYAQAYWKQTSDLALEPSWTSASVRRRAKKLAKEALETWPAPRGWAQPKPGGNEYRSLRDDASVFTFAKPKALAFGGSVYPVDTWNGLLAKAVRLMRDENPEAMREVAEEKAGDRAFVIAPRGAKWEASKKAYRHVGDGIFVYVSLSAKNTATFLRGVAKAFDAKTGSSHADDIEVELTRD